MKKILSLITILICIVMIFTSCASSPETSSNTKTTKSETSTAVPTNSKESAQENETDDTTPKKSNRLIEPEELISKEDATTLLGEAVTDSEKSEQPVVGLKLCLYEAENESSIKFLQISLTQQAFIDNAGLTPSSLYESTVSVFNGETVDGIGDKAVYTTPGLHILSGEYYILVAGGNLDDERVRTMLKDAGTLAINNLNSILDK